MKIIFFIMVFLVPALSFLPCADLKKTGEQISGAHHDLPCKEDDRDDCSPFCTCTCCAGLSIFDKPAGSQPAGTIFLFTYRAMTSPELADTDSSFWQPPRFS